MVRPQEVLAHPNIKMHMYMHVKCNFVTLLQVKHHFTFRKVIPAWYLKHSVAKWYEYRMNIKRRLMSKTNHWISLIH